MKTLVCDSKQMADEKNMRLNPLKIHLCSSIISILISHFVYKQLSQIAKTGSATRQIGIERIGKNVWQLVGNELGNSNPRMVCLRIESKK